MPDPRGFLTTARRVAPYRPVRERVRDHRHQDTPSESELTREQAGRCMGCGVPFCHTGCPLGNLIPDWNALAHTDDWRVAAEALHATNNFPELTGRLCPAPCEEACVLALNDDAVAIKQIELAIVDRAFGERWVRPRPPARATGRTAAVIGSGPAGLAAAQQLTRAGHSVTVFERDDRVGGLLRYGIPDYKLEKWVIDRRIEQMGAEGTRFETGVDVGAGLPGQEIRRRYDAIVVATGAQRPRELGLAGRELTGVEPAMAYLVQCNRRVAGLPAAGREITAAGKRVVVLGAGDTSADCLGNALREGAISVTEVAHGPTPPSQRRPLATWPEWPFLLRTYGAHQEGGTREWQVETTELLSAGGRLTGLRGRRVEFPGYEGVGPRTPPRATDAEVTLPADLLLVAIGFAGVEDDVVYSQLGVEIRDRGTVAVAAELATGSPGVFAAGDCVRGADLIVTAIADGREAARQADRYLQAVCAERSLEAATS